MSSQVHINDFAWYGLNLDEWYFPLFGLNWWVLSHLHKTESISYWVLFPCIIFSHQGLRQWWDLKSRHYDTVLFFKMGKFYELFNMDAIVGVQELGLIMMKVNTLELLHTINFFYIVNVFPCLTAWWLIECLLHTLWSFHNFC